MGAKTGGRAKSRGELLISNYQVSAKLMGEFREIGQASKFSSSYAKCHPVLIHGNI